MIILKPGDHLLYRNTWSLISWIIRVKTWSSVNHVEVYIGDGRTIAARPEGIGIYKLEKKNIYEIWRPKQMLDLTKAMAWFMEKANGQKYDYWVLLRFFNIGKESMDKQCCSELATRFDRNGDFEPFTPQTDADKVSPGMFRNSANMTLKWSKEKGNVETMAQEGA